MFRNHLCMYTENINLCKFMQYFSITLFLSLAHSPSILFFPPLIFPSFFLSQSLHFLFHCIHPTLSSSFNPSFILFFLLLSVCFCSSPISFSLTSLFHISLHSFYMYYFLHLSISPCIHLFGPPSFSSSLYSLLNLTWTF